MRAVWKGIIKIYIFNYLIIYLIILNSTLYKILYILQKCNV